MLVSAAGIAQAQQPVSTELPPLLKPLPGTTPVPTREPEGCDICGGDALAFTRAFGLSDVVAVAVVEWASVGPSYSQIYRARVTEPIRGTARGKTIYFWGGDVGRGIYTFNGGGGGGSYEIGESYLLMLRWRKLDLSGVLQGDGVPKSGPLYEAAVLNAPIRLYRNDRLNATESVFLFSGALPPPDQLKASVDHGSLVDPFRSWVGRDELLKYLEQLAAAGKRP